MNTRTLKLSTLAVALIAGLAGPAFADGEIDDNGFFAEDQSVSTVVIEPASSTTFIDDVFDTNDGN